MCIVMLDVLLLAVFNHSLDANYFLLITFFEGMIYSVIGRYYMIGFYSVFCLKVHRLL